MQYHSVNNMANTESDNSEQVKAKPVITKGVIALAHLAWICGATFWIASSLGAYGVPSESVSAFLPIDEAAYRSTGLVVVIASVLIGVPVFIFLVVRMRMSPFYPMADSVITRESDFFRPDACFYIALFIAVSIIFIYPAVGPENARLDGGIPLFILLVGVLLNIIFSRVPGLVAWFSGFVLYRRVKLIQLLEENDGRVCLACRHVLGPQALNEDKCPECGKPVVDQEHP
jgi:hypothetical protein